MKLIYGRRLATAVLQSSEVGCETLSHHTQPISEGKNEWIFIPRSWAFSLFLVCQQVANTFSFISFISLNLRYRNRSEELRFKKNCIFFKITSCAEKPHVPSFRHLGATVGLPLVFYHLRCYPLYGKKPSFKKRNKNQRCYLKLGN